MTKFPFTDGRGDGPLDYVQFHDGYYCWTRQFDWATPVDRLRDQELCYDVGDGRGYGVPYGGHTRYFRSGEAP